MIHTHEQVTGGEEYLGFARQKLSALGFARREVGAPSMTWGPCDVGGATVYIVSSDYGNLIRIDGTNLSGIILHPRSGDIEQIPYTEYVTLELGGSAPEARYFPGVRGGWANGRTLLSTAYLYPLVDDDDASFILGKEDDTTTGIFAEETGSYGNLYWTNGATDDDLVVLSWRGTPTRHFRIPGNINIPGLSIVERVTPGLVDDIPEFTTFGTKVYEGGDVALQAPRFSWPQGGHLDRGLILGVMRNSDGVTFIITQNDHHEAPKYGWHLSDGETIFGDDDDVIDGYRAAHYGVRIVAKKEITKPGYYIGVWSSAFSTGNKFRVYGWELLLEIPHQREGVPWFGNASGTAFVCSNGDSITITYEKGQTTTISADYTEHVDVSGSYVETIPNDYRYELSISSSISNLLRFYEYSNNTKVSGIVNLSFSSSSVQHSGEWIVPDYETGANGLGAFEITVYYDNSKADVSYSPVCYIGLPHQAEPLEYEFMELSTQTPCILYNWLYQPVGTGRQTAVWHGRQRTIWEGDWPGTEHTIQTNYTIQVCGVTIPVVVTDRYWQDSRGPHQVYAAGQQGKMPLTVTEHCSITRSTIHFLDQRYGVCLYKTQVDEIEFNYEGTEVCHLVAYGVSNIPYTQCTIREDLYTAQTTEKWHLVIGGVDTVVAEATVPLIPFGEPIGSGVDEGIIKLLVFPVMGASVGHPVGSTEPIARLGCYEYGYADPFAGQSQLDGGRDHYYPEWCRGLQEDPFWKAAAASRFMITMPQSEIQPTATNKYTPPEVFVEPMPQGSFALHPVVGDLYQFLVEKFNNTKAVVITSQTINDLIDEQLAQAKDEEGVSLGLKTSGTTLYYPISVI